jgi:hypothetical protein
MNCAKVLCAIWASLAVLPGLAGAESPVDFPTSAAPYLAAYRWGAANKHGGAAANEAFARWLSRPVVWAEDFEPNERWDSLEGGDWQLGEWSRWKKAVAGRWLILSVPLLPGSWDRSGPRQGDGVGKPVSLAAGALGDYNARFKKLAEHLVHDSLADSVLRLGWEFNGGWYNWRAGENPQAFAKYWQQIVRTIRAVPGTEKIQFCWNPALGYQQFPAEKAWPGDEWVDFVGLDVYDDSWLANTYPFPPGASREQIDQRRRTVWDKVVLHGDHGLMFWRDFAAEHRKAFSIPEWGVDDREGGHGGLDNAMFVEQMHAFIADRANRVFFHCYFDVQASDGGHQLSPGLHGTDVTRFPQASARFRSLFGVATGHGAE